MESNIVIALVVSVAVAAHVAIFHWVRFKIHEAVIVKCLQGDGQEGAKVSQHPDAIARATELSVKRVAVVCRKSAGIEPDIVLQGHWRSSRASA